MNEAATPSPPDDGTRARDVEGARGEDVEGARGEDVEGTRPGGAATPRRRPARKQVLLRLDPAVHDALARWAADDLRSVNAQIDMVVRRALADAGRLPRDVGPARRPGRPRHEG
ncbi:hypothetical protein ACNHYB_12265 [Isoptericola jiangsuensis]|uniref:hypothetical protein n=1 Tax=Isoptericola jiangsuensis TaxID=548579 RepID=UPI003AAD5069